MNRCIQCYRCVRYYRDYAGGEDLNVFAAHNHVYFGREKDGVLESPFSGNLVEICPTGVFTDKTLKEHYTRKWDLTSAPSVCHHCSLGCNIIASERYGQLRCITNKYNSEVNGYFLCDRGRYGYEFVNSDNRITRPIIRNRAAEAADETDLNNHLKSILSNHTVIGIGSPRASVETNFALMQLTGKENFYQGIDGDQVFLEKLVVDIFNTGNVPSASLKDIEQADAVLILGEDVWNTAPVMALAVRQSVMKTAALAAVQQVPIPVWNDAAVKEVVQEDKGFLANCSVVSSQIDEIATSIYRAAPDDIARLGFIVASLLNPSLPADANADETLLSKAKIISDALQKAKRPVIISGISCYNQAIIRASFTIAAALNTTERKAGLCYVLPECNSMGLAMMKNSSFDQALTRVQLEENITAIIVENDLYRHITPEKANAFFSRCKNIVVLDSLNNKTTEKAHVLIPAASFAEADGTLINNEGRAQHFYQVYIPSNKYIKESWKWLLQIKTLLSQSGNGQDHHPEELLKELENTFPQFAGISKSVLAHNLRVNGQLIPREPHRYSGRTAMHANINVSEPKPLQDEDSPLSYTMEGYRGIPPDSAIPFFWSPGWNSVQSVNKYQEEVGGLIQKGNPGVELFRMKPESAPTYFTDRPEAFKSRSQKWLLLPQYDVLGSGELSIYTKGIEKLSPEAHIFLSKNDMDQLGVTENELIKIEIKERKYSLPVKTKKELCNGVALVSAGLKGVEAMDWGSWATLGPDR
jgi:NADH-quinone oxidoreductase subunit G